MYIVESFESVVRELEMGVRNGNAEAAKALLDYYRFAEDNPSLLRTLEERKAERKRRSDDKQSAWLKQYIGKCCGSASFECEGGGDAARCDA